ncbi:MAG: glycosyltransferase [Candidatus Hodarchaeota archaeon]
MILSVTVVIPVKNERNRILMGLRSLINQSHLPNEVWVIDDCSTDGTWEALLAFKNTFSLPFPLYLHRIEYDNKNRAYLRNYGTSRASSDLVAFMDGDCIAVKSWLFHLTRPLLASSCPPELVGTGGIMKSYHQTLLGELFEVMSGSIYKSPSKLSFLVGGNCCYKKEVLEEIGGFNEEIFTGEDSEIGVRLVHQGYCFRYVPNAVVYNQFPSKILELIRKFFKYGQGAYFTYQTEKAIVLKSKKNKRKIHSFLFFEKGESLLRQVNLHMLIRLMKRFAKTVKRSPKTSDLAIQDNTDSDAIKLSQKRYSFPRKILFLFFASLAYFSYLRGFIWHHRLVYKISDMSKKRNANGGIE